MAHTLAFDFESTYCSGWPQLEFVIDNQLFLEHQIAGARETVYLDVAVTAGHHQLCINKISSSPDSVQPMVLVDIFLDEIKLPFFVKHSGIFCFNNTQHAGSVWWEPNGSWLLDFQVPVTDWIIKSKRMAETAVSDLLPYSQRLSLQKDLQNFLQELDQDG